MPSKPKFPGKLGERIKPRRIGLLVGADRATQLRNRWESEDTAKLDELARHYGIEPPTLSPVEELPSDAEPFDHLAANAITLADFYRRLVTALARETVPAFREIDTGSPGASGGRPPDSPWLDGLLVVAFDQLRHTEKGRVRSDNEIATQLCKREPWNRVATGKAPADSLRMRYGKAKSSRYAKTLRQARKSYVAESTLSEWEQFCREWVAELIDG